MLTEVLPSKSVVEVVRSLESRDGVLTPVAVVDEARNPDSPLHGRFEWDDGVAAEQYRLSQAEVLIRRVRIVLHKQDKSLVSANRYVSVGMANTEAREYRAVTRLKKGQVTRLMQDELARILGNVRRTRELAEVHEASISGGLLDGLRTMEGDAIGLLNLVDGR